MNDNMTHYFHKIRLSFYFAFCSFLALSAPLSMAVDSPDPNVVLALKTWFAEPALDNVSGAFRPLAEEAVKDLFLVNSRFELARDKKSADGIIKMKIFKKADGIELETELDIGSTGEVFTINQATIGSELSGVAGVIDDNSIRKALGALLRKSFKHIPFYGSVTGRDGDNVTLDIGTNQGIRDGDFVQISRVENFKRHPFLKQIVDVQTAAVGTIKVVRAEDQIAFGIVDQQMPGEKIRRLHKVTAIEHPIDLLSQQSEFKSSKLSKEKKARFGGSNSSIEGETPHYGFLNFGVELASFSNTSSSNSTTVSGSALSPGFLLGGELWLTNQIFIEPQLGGNVMSYSHSGGSSTVQNGITASTTNFGLDAGYRFLFEDSIYGPQVFGKIGYHNFRWSVSTNASDLLTLRTYSGLGLMFGGTLPFGNAPFGATIQVGIQLLNQYSEATTVIGTDGSSNVVKFYLGGYYFMSSRLSIRCGFDFQSYSHDFDTPVSARTQQKVIGILPSVQYYF